VFDNGVAKKYRFYSNESSLNSRRNRGGVDGVAGFPCDSTYFYRQVTGEEFWDVVSIQCEYDRVLSS